MPVTAALGRVLATIRPCGSVTIGADWLQGKATFGGLSAAICLQAVMRQVHAVHRMEQD